MGALPAEVTFTSGGTEANNLALSGSGRRRMLVSAIEHDSVLRAATNTELVAVGGNGVVDLAALEKMLRSSREPALVSVMFANNETGVLQPIADVVRLASKAGALVHCDAVQGAGKLPIDLHALGVDYLSLSAHKLGGPTGVGALVVRNGAPLIAGQLGGGQELNRRAGTENVAGIAGFGAAAVAARGGLDVAGLRDRMERTLLASAPQARVFGADGCRWLHTGGIFLALSAATEACTLERSCSTATCVAAARTWAFAAAARACWRRHRAPL